MDLRHAITMTYDLMRKNNVPSGWTVVFDRAKMRNGQTRYVPRELGLSTHFVQNATAEQVRMTALHEIAHILTPGNGHNDVWRRKCIQIGGDGKRLASNKKNGIPAAVVLWKTTCPSHPTIDLGGFNRKPKHAYVHKGCGTVLVLTRNR